MLRLFCWTGLVEPDFGDKNKQVATCMEEYLFLFGETRIPLNGEDVLQASRLDSVQSIRPIRSPRTADVAPHPLLTPSCYWMPCFVALVFCGEVPARTGLQPSQTGLHGGRAPGWMSADGCTMSMTLYNDAG